MIDTVRFDGLDVRSTFIDNFYSTMPNVLLLSVPLAQIMLLYSNNYTLNKMRKMKNSVTTQAYLNTADLETPAFSAAVFRDHLRS